MISTERKPTSGRLSRTIQPASPSSARGRLLSSRMCLSAAPSPTLRARTDARRASSPPTTPPARSRRCSSRTESRGTSARRANPSRRSAWCAKCRKSSRPAPEPRSGPEVRPRNVGIRRRRRARPARSTSRRIAVARAVPWARPMSRGCPAHSIVVHIGLGPSAMAAGSSPGRPGRFSAAARDGSGGPRSAILFGSPRDRVRHNESRGA